MVKRSLKSDEVTPKREVEAHTPKNRPKRRPLTTTYKLALPDGIVEDGFKYRWVIDRPDRVLQFEEAWWQIAKDGEGKTIRKPSGTGEYLVLYRIEEKYWEEDRDLHRKKNIDLLTEAAKPRKEKDGFEYVPEGHEAVVKFS